MSRNCEGEAPKFKPTSAVEAELVIASEGQSVFRVPAEPHWLFKPQSGLRQPIILYCSSECEEE